MKKSFDYHDPRAKNIIVKAMTESHMVHHYRKIQNVIPYVDTNIRKKAAVQSCVVRCECGNRIHTNSDYSRWNLRQKEYKKTVGNGIPCSRFRKCFNDSTIVPTFKPYSKTGESKLKFLTDIYHPPRAKSSTATKNEEDCSNLVSESDASNLDESGKIDSDHIELLKKITDDILNNSLYTSWELKKLFQEHIMSNEDLTQEEMQSEIDNLEQELRFADDNLSPPKFHESGNISSLKPSSYLSLRLDNLNINPKTLLSIKEALNLRQTEDSFSQTYHDSISSVKSSDENPNDEMYNYSPESIVEDKNSDHSEKPDLNEEDDEVIPDASQQADDNSDKDDLESLDDLSSIHSYQN